MMIRRRLCVSVPLHSAVSCWRCTMCIIPCFWHFLSRSSFKLLKSLHSEYFCALTTLWRVGQCHEEAVTVWTASSAEWYLGDGCVLFPGQWWELPTPTALCPMAAVAGSTPDQLCGMIWASVHDWSSPSPILQFCYKSGPKNRRLQHSIKQETASTGMQCLSGNCSLLVFLLSLFPSATFTGFLSPQVPTCRGICGNIFGCCQV